MHTDLELPDTAKMKKIKKGEFVFFEDKTVYNENEVLLIKKIKSKKPKEDLVNFVHLLKKKLGMILTDVK